MKRGTLLTYIDNWLVTRDIPPKKEKEALAHGIRCSSATAHFGCTSRHLLIICQSSSTANPILANLLGLIWSKAKFSTCSFNKKCTQCNQQLNKDIGGSKQISQGKFGCGSLWNNGGRRNQWGNERSSKVVYQSKNNKTYHGSSQCKTKHGKSMKLGFMLLTRNTPATVQGLRTAKCSWTVWNWYQEFCKERKIQVKLLLGKHNMPPFLQQNQDTTLTIKQYAC